MSDACKHWNKNRDESSLELRSDGDAWCLLCGAVYVPQAKLGTLEIERSMDQKLIDAEQGRIRILVAERDEALRRLSRVLEIARRAVEAERDLDGYYAQGQIDIGRAIIDACAPGVETKERDPSRLCRGPACPDCGSDNTVRLAGDEVECQPCGRVWDSPFVVEKQEI
jgi:hypothetical protein